MGQKDLTGKNFMLYPDIYADTLNALAYAGKGLVCPENLLPAPTESIYPTISGKLTNQFSDVSMFEMQNGVIHIQYIFENEVYPKPGTILRKAGYEGVLYRRQYGSNEFYPIVSLLLYWGSSPWTQPISIKEFFGEAGLDKDIWRYISNEKLHVYRMSHLTKQVRNRFHSDMRIVVDYLAEGHNYKPSKQKICHPESLLLMLEALTGDQRYLKIIKTLSEKEKGGEITMCELLDKYENRGIRKGMRKGMQKGIRQGLQQGESRFAALSENLLNLNRIDDLRKAAANKQYRNKLYKEFGIV